MVVNKLKAAFSSIFSPQKKHVPLREKAHAYINATYDSIYNTPENARHWQWADYLSADESADPFVRKEIRSRARYEIQENNAYGKGIALTLAQDTVGTGPRLQLQLNDTDANSAVEDAYHRWALASGFTQKLMTLRLAKAVDGEAVAKFVTNNLLEDTVQLDLQIIECDQLESPHSSADMSATYVDGVHLDNLGNAIAYDIKRHHPGGQYAPGNPEEFTTYGRDQILHLFRVDRPGQHRGISEFAASLPLFAFLRRFTLATIAAAETAANVSQVMETDTPIPEELEEELAVAAFNKFMDTVPVDRNSATVLPNGWKMRQMTAEHPTTTYEMFKQQIISEIARTVNMPRNKAAADSSNYNYASGRLDYLDYNRSIQVERNYWERNMLDRVFSQWLYESALSKNIPYGVAQQVLRYVDTFGPGSLAFRVAHGWFWQNPEDADVKNYAEAQNKLLMNGTTHRAREYALRGLDVDSEDRRAAESFGMTVDEYRKKVAAAIFSNGNDISGQQKTPTAPTPSQPPQAGSNDETQ